MTPYWYAIVSESCPAINTTRKTEPEAASLAGKLREDYPDVEVVPMYRDAGARAGDGIPAGFKLVPIELTDQMRDAGNEIVANRWLLSQAWRAMLAAAPAAAPADLSDEQIEAAVAAWFKEQIQPGRYPFAKRMRAAIGAALAAAPAVSAPAGWISVADRLPPKFAEVMIAFAGSALPSTGQYTGNLRDSADGWSYPSENSGDDTDWTVTHWRPLPEHPEAHRFAGSPDAAALAAVQAPATGDAA